MHFSLLLAADERGTIGKDNRLPWHLPADLRYFKNLTWGMPVLMGRKTWDSIGKPLPGRKSIVITRQPDWTAEGAQAVHSIEAALRLAAESGVREVFVIGGAEIFRSALPQASRIYLTRIHHSFEGDTFFDGPDDGVFRLVSERRCPPDAKNPWPHSFQVWERIKQA